ncbi:hypothetical protein DFJ73DRAFT_89353 [Zopfochytrium polystomum]|nr:hypothetical protein DFJ73DRAFT_89353 [Zopfochytrium polystomum]
MIKKWGNRQATTTDSSSLAPPHDPPKQPPKLPPSAADGGEATIHTLTASSSLLDTLPASVRLTSSLETTPTMQPETLPTTTPHHKDAQAFPVRAATIFRTAKFALVSRTIPIGLKSGHNSVFVDRLPTAIDTSIQAPRVGVPDDAAGVSLVSVKYHAGSTAPGPTSPKHPATTEESEALKSTLTLVLVAAEDVEVEIEIAYLVDGAKWWPFYDIRAYIGKGTGGAGEGEQHHVMIHYRAVVSQTTGEEWKNVALTLSLGGPSFNVPTLRQVNAAGIYNSSSAKTPSNASGFSPPGSSSDLDVEKSILLRPSTNSDWIPLVSNFEIAAPASVSSRDTTKETTVFVAELVLESIDLEWIVVPKESSTAFIQCKITNATTYDLFPGSASVFVGNTFVATTSIPRVQPHESFTTCFGPDALVQVTRSPLAKKRTSTASGSSTYFSRRTAIYNGRSAVLPKLIIRDRVPIASNGRLTLLAPADLPVGADSWKGVHVRDGVRARYVQKNDEERAEGEKGDGTIEWVCKPVPAGHRFEVSLVWELVAAAGLKWTLSETDL